MIDDPMTVLPASPLELGPSRLATHPQAEAGELPPRGYANWRFSPAKDF